MKEKPSLDKTVDKLKTFEQIKSPKELFEFMTKNISYGFVGKSNQKHYRWDDADWESDFGKEYFLQSPAELIESGTGVCWDSAELEREWFAGHGYDHKVYFMGFAIERENNLPTHTFLVYKQDGKYYWFEHSDGNNRGIHEYENLEELLADAKKKHIDYAKKEGNMIPEDEKDFCLFEFDRPKFGCGANDFIDHVFPPITIHT